MLDLSKLLDVLLEVWVLGTGCILHNAHGSDHGGVGKSNK